MRLNPLSTARVRIPALVVACVCVAAIWDTLGGAAANAAPISLSCGPQLFVDDYLIASQTGFNRRINSPTRLAGPVVTAVQDGNITPYITVLQDPATSRFRMWYDTYTANASVPSGFDTRLGYMESPDGINWVRPRQLLTNPQPISFGASVYDEGPTYSNPSARYKLAFYGVDTVGGGDQIATSPDGLTWTPIAAGPEIAANHDIVSITYDPLRRQYLASTSATNVPGYVGLRIPTQSVSTDMVHWQTPWATITPDARDLGTTQFYGMAGVVARGNLLIGNLKVLRDDQTAQGAPAGAYGIGYTCLAWSRDGVHWERDTQPFIDRNTTPGTFDYGMAWGDSQLVVGDKTYIYYGGYHWGHKYGYFTDRDIGLAIMDRDRYVSRDAGNSVGTLLTPVFVSGADQITVNANVDGELRIRVLDRNGNPLSGFGWSDFSTIHGDSVALSAQWQGSFSALKGLPIALEFSLTNGQLYGFDLVSAPEPSTLLMLGTAGLIGLIGLMVRRREWNAEEQMRIHPESCLRIRKPTIGAAMFAVLVSAAGVRAGDVPIALPPGPQLFIDDYLIASQTGFRRTINSPTRLSTPLVNGVDDHNVAPYVTVLRDPNTSQFRMWYNYNVAGGSNYLACLESPDGINWVRPSQTLADLGAASSYGARVVDDGLSANPTTRYKHAWWAHGSPDGMHIATSPDGLAWTPIAAGAVLPTDASADILSMSYDPLRRQYIASGSIYTTGDAWTGQRRIPTQSVSADLVNWQTPWQTIKPDAQDSGVTEFYGMSGVTARGGLLVGMLKVLRDDLYASEEAKSLEARGIGYTVLTWSRDGINWERDREPFIDRSPVAGDWHHAMAWGDYQLVVGNETYIYYGGYRWGHKLNRNTDRQIGLATMLKDRYVSRDADAGSLTTPVFVASSDSITINASVNGELRIAVLDESGNPLPGFGLSDFVAIRGDSISHPALWAADFSGLMGRSIALEFSVTDGQLYGFELINAPEPSTLLMLGMAGLIGLLGRVVRRRQSKS